MTGVVVHKKINTRIKKFPLGNTGRENVKYKVVQKIKYN
jgi:hypothetical protein